MKASSSTLIGVIGQILTFDVNDMILARGDRVYLVTDGIPETVNEKHDIHRIRPGSLDLFLGMQARFALPDTLDAVIEETVRFRNGHPQQDDITLIGFEVL